jgi:hypothetical protein
VHRIHPTLRALASACAVVMGVGASLAGASTPDEDAARVLEEIAGSGACHGRICDHGDCRILVAPDGAECIDVHGQGACRQGRCFAQGEQANSHGAAIPFPLEAWATPRGARCGVSSRLARDLHRNRGEAARPRSLD